MLNVNMDDNVKSEFQSVVGELGMNATTAVNLFARAVIREKGIPFPVTLRTQAEQDWNDYLAAEIRMGYEHMISGEGMTNAELKKYLAENGAS